MPKSITETQKLGSRFKQIRILLSKSQKEVSDEISYSQSNLSQLENGINEPGSSLLRRLAEKYPQVNIDWIVTGKGTPIKGEQDKSITDVTEELRAQIKSLNERVRYLEKENTSLMKIISKASNKK
jgi:transcriptional regulator with XRE-family HTH domain